MSPRGLKLCAGFLSSTLLVAGWDLIQAREANTAVSDWEQAAADSTLVLRAPGDEPATETIRRDKKLTSTYPAAIGTTALRPQSDEADDGSAGPNGQGRISAEAVATESANDTDSDSVDVADGSTELPSKQPTGGDQPVMDAATATENTKTVAPLTPQLVELRDKVRSVLKLYYPRHLNTRDHSNWEVMHGIISYGVDAKLFRGGPNGEKVNAIGWVCFNGSCAGEQMLYVNNNQLVARKGPGVQGHYGQFLAILAQSHVRSDYPIRVGGKSFTVADLIEHEKQDCEDGEELTFKLIALMHYLDSNATWKTRTGQQWSIERLIQSELKQPIRGAACGGTHRLMGFSYAVNKRQKRGEPMTGQFERARAYIQDYHRYAFSLQNPDGSFSTAWLTRPEAKQDVDRRLKTTGHVLEWLSFSLSDEELRHPKTIKAVDYIASILSADKTHAWEVGPLGHALHGLALYDQRVFQTAESTDAQPVVVDDSPTLDIESPADVVKKSKPIELRK